MYNPRLTIKERNLLKGAIRRVFSRSELRRSVAEDARVEYTDPTRPRVKKWGICASCHKPSPLYLMEVDHIHPIVPTNTKLEDMSWDELVNNLWCEKNNLQLLDKACHNEKCKEERKARKNRPTKLKRRSNYGNQRTCFTNRRRPGPGRKR